MSVWSGTGAETKRKLSFWYAVDVTLLDAGATAAREAISYALMEAGALGTETTEGNLQPSRITAYFETRPERDLLQEWLDEGLRIYDLPASLLSEMSFSNSSLKSKKAGATARSCSTNSASKEKADERLERNGRGDETQIVVLVRG